MHETSSAHESIVLPSHLSQPVEHRELANTIRALSMDAVEQAKSGLKGGCVISGCEYERALTLIASGSGIAIAMDSRKLLEAEAIPCAVISMPCLTLFEQQPAAYRDRGLGPQGGARIVIEAGVRQGWESVMGPNGSFIDMSGFGASDPAPELYRHFGITPEAAVAAAKALL